MMLYMYIKYESLGSCSLKEETFLMHFENLFFDPVTCLWW